MYEDIFKNAPQNVKIEKTDRYMDLFGTSSQASETSPKYDLFGDSGKKANNSSDIFKDVQSVDRAARFISEPKSEPVVVQVLDAASAFDCNYMHLADVERDFKLMAAENEKCTNVLIDVSQEMQSEYARIEQVYTTLVALVDSIKQALSPKKTWLGKEVPIDVAEVNRLIDKAQDGAKEPFKIDFFLVSKIQDAFDKSRRCDAKVEKLERSMEHMIAHGGAQKDDPLYKRIVTTRKMVELQNISTEKTLKMLHQSYDRVEEFRQNSLMIVLIDAQSKLIK